MTLHQETSNKTLILTVDRPEARNAISAAIATALADALERASDDTDVHAVILAATGDDVFIAGGDLNELSALAPDAGGADRVLEMGQLLAAIERCVVPVIAAVNGVALGGGSELLMMCDLVVMERHASIQFVHARMGLAPAWGGATRLVERVGSTRAAEMLLCAAPVSAVEALATGLCNRLATRGTARHVAGELADRLAKLPRTSLVAIKRALIGARTSDRAVALEQEREAFRTVWGSDAHTAAMARFTAKKTAG